MVNKFLVIGFLIGIVFGIIGMLLFESNVSKPNQLIYDAATKKLDERIRKDSILIDSLKKNVKIEIREIEKIKTKYVTIYKAVDVANLRDLDVAFDSLLSE
jgi:hypothetical protein